MLGFGAGFRRGLWWVFVGFWRGLGKKKAGSLTAAGGMI